MVAHIAHRLCRHHGVVNTQNDISLLQASLSSRHIGIGLVDYYTIQLLVLPNKGSNTCILTSKHHPQVLCLILSIILCIGVQAPEHGCDTYANGLLRFQGIHIQQFQILVYIIEDIEMFGHLKVVVTSFLSPCRQRQA